MSYARTQHKALAIGQLSLPLIFMLILFAIRFLFLDVLFQWTETGLRGPNGHSVQKFVMAVNRLGPESAITQPHSTAVMTAREISRKQDPVTFSHVLVRQYL